MLNFLHRVFRKIFKETGLFSLLWKITSLRPFLWKIFSQPGEYFFHKTVGKEFRLSEEFNVQTAEFFAQYGFKSDDFVNKNILDIGAGSRLRTCFFSNSNIYVIEPLANEYMKMEQSDLHKAKKVFSDPAEKYFNEFEGIFSFIVCINVLDHCYDEVKVLENIYNYLMKGGIFLLSVDIHESPKDPMHPVSFSQQTLLKALKNIGFSILSEYTSDGEFTHDKTVTYKLVK